MWCDQEGVAGTPGNIVPHAPQAADEGGYDGVMYGDDGSDGCGAETGSEGYGYEGDTYGGRHSDHDAARRPPLDGERLPAELVARFLQRKVCFKGGMAAPHAYT